MLKHIKKISLFISLTLIFWYCKDEKAIKIISEQENSILFKDKINLGLIVGGKKEGVWRLKVRDTIEFKCYYKGLPDSITLFFLIKDNKQLPLGVKINNLKQGLWFNYDNPNDYLNIFNQDKKLMKKNLQKKELISGKKIVIGWVDNFNQKSGLYLTYGDTDFLFSSVFVNDIMTGVFIVNPLRNDSTYFCSCAKNGYLNGYSIKYYLNDEIASLSEYQNGKTVKIETHFNKNGDVFRKIDHSGNVPKIIYGIDSNVFLPPLPLPN